MVDDGRALPPSTEPLAKPLRIPRLRERSSRHARKHQGFGGSDPVLTGCGEGFASGSTINHEPSTIPQSSRLFVDGLDCGAALRVHLLPLLVALEPLEAVGEVRRCGTMVGIELVKDRAGKEPFAPEVRFTKRVILEARRRGVILRPLGEVLVLMPHLSFSDDELSMLVKVAAESIACIWREVNA